MSKFYTFPDKKDDLLFKNKKLQLFPDQHHQTIKVKHIIYIQSVPYHIRLSHRKTVYRLAMYVLYTRKWTLHWFYAKGQAIRFNLYMQYAGYVYVDLKSNNCFKISFPAIQITPFLFKLMYPCSRKIIHNTTFNWAVTHFYGKVLNWTKFLETNTVLQFIPPLKGFCKHQYGGLNVLYTYYRTKARPDFSFVTVQSLRFTYIKRTLPPPAFNP